MEQSRSVGEDLFPTQVQAAALLAAGHSLDEVCQTLSIGRSTLYRWRQTPDFAAYLHQLLRTQADQSLCQSAQFLSQATAKIKSLMDDPNTPPELQLKIAFKILALYSRPSYLKMLQSLPDTADDVIRADFRRAQAGQEPREMTTEDAKSLADHYRNSLRAAESFDRLFPNPIEALDRSKMTQNGTSGTISPPARTEMTQNGTSGAQCRAGSVTPPPSLTKAIDAALAGPKENIVAA